MSRKKTTDRADWRDYRAQIIAKLDLAAEFEALGIEIVGSPGKDGWVSCRAVDREDSEPSAGVNVRTGFYRDLGGTGLFLGFFDLAAHVKKYPSWKAARDHYAAVTGIKPAGQPPRDPAEHLVFLPWNDRTPALWAMKKPGVSVESIVAAGGRLARYRDKHTVIALPIYGAALTAAEPIGWCLYNATGDNLPVFHGRDKKTGKSKTSWKKVKITGGSESGIIGQQAIERIRQQKPGDRSVVWKVEGPSDLLALWSAIPMEKRDRHLVLANSGGCQENPKAWMAGLFYGHLAAVVGDADAPGQDGALKWAKWISRHAGEVRLVRAGQLGYEVAADHGQDLRDWLNTPHTYAELLDLVDAAEVVTETTPAPLASSALDSPLSALDSSDLIEADDDPHRLARVNLARYATRLGVDGKPAGRTLRYWRDEWYVWKGLHYQRITIQEFRAKLTGSVREEFERLARQAAAMAEKKSSDDSGQPEVKKVHTVLISNVMQATSGMVCLSSAVEPGTWLVDKSRKNWISLANGILDIDALLAGGEMADCLKPNSPDWFSFVSLPYAFDRAARCPRFDAFLEKNLELDPERIKLLQEWAGYLLTPDTSEQKFMLLEGEGKNGKSVFLAALTAMLGRENVSNVPLENFGHRFALTGTLGKLLNACTDCSEIEKAAEGVFKSFTSGDRMFFDRKGISGLTCEPTARVMLAANQRPRVNDRSQGVWRRMLLVPWRVQIDRSQRVGGMDTVAFWQRHGELPGILNWAIAGLARLRAQGGFTESEVMQQAIQDYQEEMNPARAFLLANFETNQGTSLESPDIYKFYRKWCEENGHHPLSSGIFGKEVRRVFPTAERHQKTQSGNKTWCWKGIKFSQDEICGESTSGYTLF